MTRITDSAHKTVSAIAVIDLANELISHGCLDVNDLISLGASFNDLFSAWKNNQAIQEERLPESLLIELWKRVSQSEKYSELGLVIGSKVNNQAKGVLANWLSHCSTLDESFNTFRKNIHLLNPSETWGREDLQGKVKISIGFNSRDYPLTAVDRSMAAAIAWSEILVGENIRPTSAFFVRSQPKQPSRYYELFGKNVLFDQPQNTLVFPKSVFEKPITAANVYLKSLLEKQALELSASLMAIGSMTGKVEALLNQDLTRFCHIDEICNACHLSRSTLYRKLKAEGVNYTNLVRRARLKKYDALIAKTLQHGEISDALGFSDIGSYYRFKKEYVRD